MATSPQMWAEIQSTFQKDLPITVKLQKLLNQERTALENREYDDFQLRIKAKNQLVNELKKHADARIHALQAAGLTNEEEALAAAELEAPIVARSWRQLAKQWEDCQHHNAVNERIVQRTKLVVSQTLDLIRGVTQQQKLYDTKGMPDNIATGRSITSA